MRFRKQKTRQKRKAEGLPKKNEKGKRQGDSWTTGLERRWEAPGRRQERCLRANKTDAGIYNSGRGLG